MSKRTSLLIGIIVHTLIYISMCDAQTAESITVTTYYPSPYGVYKNLRIFPNDDNTPGAACANEGETYYDASDHALYICGGSPTKWEPASVPSRAVMFFNDNTGPNGGCPPGWSPLAAAQGRYLVGLRPGGTIAGTQGSALSNLEDRPAGAHSHRSSDSGFVTAGGSPSTIGPGPNEWFIHTSVTVDIQNPAAPAGTNAPYIQLLACEKD